MAKEQDRFVTVHEEGGFVSQYRVVADTSTGVQYLIATYGSGTGMSVLVDREGKPLLYRPPVKGGPEL